MFTKEEIKQRWRDYAQKVSEKNGGVKPTPGLNLALLIASSALIGQKQWDGTDYMGHPIWVGFNNTKSERKRIIGVLHDVVEDSDWTLEDFREIGFDERIIQGVAAMTKNSGELYLDFIERCGMSALKQVYKDGSRQWERVSALDGIEGKMDDLEHNSMNVRSPGIDKTDKQVDKGSIYNFSYYYLLGIKKFIQRRRNEEVEAIISGQLNAVDFAQEDDVYPGMPVEVFMNRDPFNSNPEQGKRLLERFSSRFNENKKRLRRRPVGNVIRGH